MAYATKYRFTFESTHGATYRILIQKDGYSGSIINRPLGRAPVLQRKNSGRVYGTSLEIYAECNVDGEFSELYTSSATEFRVQLYKGNSLKWSGFVSPELYSEPDVAPPYDVHIIATDGLGELKQHNFEAIGDNTLQSLFGYLLMYTGLSASTNFVSALSATDSNGGLVTAANLWSSAFINVDYMAGKTCYDVLQYLLDTLCACITMQDAGWLIWRENDITSSDVPVSLVTSMGAGGLWPIGYMNRKVVPAKKSISVEAPFHLWTTLVNPDMTQDSGWSKTRYAYIASEGAYRVTPAEYSPDIDPDYLSQSVSLIAGPGKEFNLEVTFDPHFTLLDGTVGTLHFNISFSPAGLPTLYLNQKNDGTLEWSATRGSWPWLNPGVSGTPSTKTLYIPPIENTGYAGVGMLTIGLSFQDDVASDYYGGAIYSCFLYPVGLPYGFKDILAINNGARGEGSNVEIAHGRTTSDIYTAFNGYLRGVFKSSGGFYLVTFKDRNFTANSQEFLSLTAKNYARLVATSRLRLTGVLDTPETLSVLPMMLNLRGVYYLVENYSWNLLDDELEFSALSLPDGVLQVASETIINTTKESSPSDTSGGSSGGGGGGGGSTVVWGTAANNYRPLTVDGDQSTVALEGHTHNLDDITDGTTYKKVTQQQINIWNNKQNALTFDDTPTAGSNNPVKSGGIKTALDGKQDTLTFDDVPVANSSNPVKSGGLFNRFAEIVNMIAQKATAAWGAVTNYVAKLTINGAEKEVLLKGWNPGVAGNTGLPTYAHPGGEESYKYTKGASGTEQTITEELNAGQPRKIDHIGTHPELSAPVAIPGFINDLAYFRQRGGGCKLYVNNVERTDERYAYYKDAMFNCGPGSMAFDGTHTYTPEGGSPTTYHLGLTSPNDTARISLDFTTLLDAAVQLDSTYFTTKFAYGSYLYIDFGNDWWGPRECTAIVKYGRYKRDAQGGVYDITEDTANRQTFKYTGPGDEGHLDFLRLMINSNTSYGIIGIDVVMTGFHEDTGEQTIYKYKPRVSEIGVVGLSSRGPAEGLMARGADDPVYRSITPAKADTYDLGAAAKRWRYAYVKRVYLSATAYLEIGQDGKAHLYGATGLVVNNGDIASAGAPQS